MKYETTPEATLCHTFIFNPQESRIISAAYCEYGVELSTLEGQPSSISSQDETFMLYDGTERYLTDNPLPVIERLEAFHENTAQAKARIPEDTGIPAYMNKHIAIRAQVGAKALELATEMRQKAGLSEEALDEIEDAFKDLDPSDIIGEQHE